MRNAKRIASLLLLLALLFCIGVSAYADKADFEYKLTLTDQDGREVINPRDLAAGSTLTVEIELTRKDTNAASYETYGMEFRLMSRGLEYNNDGASFRNGTPVKLLQYDSGDSVGFAYYDMEQKGERIANPVLAGRWSYTVTDPSAVNITVPVALLYIVNDSESYEPVGNARLFLDPNGGKIIGEDVSGEYPSGTIVTLPDAEFAEYVFLGWSDGVQLYPAGHNFTVSGVVTLVAQWEGLVRDRQVIFDAQGGQIDGEDPSGMYADGEVVTMPPVAKEGYNFLGWQMGGKLYQVGEEYTVDNSVVFIAQWEKIEVPTETPGPDDSRQGEEDGEGWGRYPILALIVLALVGLGWWLLIILWARRWVKYSLVNGDVALSHKEKEHNVQVEVILFTEDENGNKIEYHLNKSHVVEAKHRLRFIHGQLEAYPIVPVKKGRYKGKLIMTDGLWRNEEKVRIKVLDRELRERENR